MLYFKSFKIHIKKLMQYRISTVLAVIAQTLTAVMAILSIYFLFNRFNIVEGWTMKQVAVSYAIAFIGFSFNGCFFRGVDQFSHLIKSGGLDGFFVRPRGILHQVVCSKVEISKLGRVLTGIIVLIVACSIQPFTWTFSKIVVLLLMIVSAIVIFFSLLLIGAAFSIYTIEGLEVMNIFTDGGRQMCQYPLTIYGKAVKIIFTYIIPFATFNYIPMQYLFDMNNASFWTNGLAPILGCLVFIPAYIFFRISLKKYASTGT